MLHTSPTRRNTRHALTRSPPTASCEVGNASDCPGNLADGKIHRTAKNPRLRIDRAFPVGRARHEPGHVGLSCASERASSNDPIGGTESAVVAFIRVSATGRPHRLAAATGDGGGRSRSIAPWQYAGSWGRRSPMTSRMPYGQFSPSVRRCRSVTASDATLLAAGGSACKVEFLHEAAHGIDGLSHGGRRWRARATDGQSRIRLGPSSRTGCCDRCRELVELRAACRPWPRGCRRCRCVPVKSGPARTACHRPRTRRQLAWMLAS